MPIKPQNLQVVATQEIREVVTRGESPKHFEELAIGKTRRCIFVRGPKSKRLFILDCPEELLEELTGRYVAPKRPVVRKGKLQVVK